MFGVAQNWSVGVPHELQDDLHVVLAPNPSPMTGPGTNTFLVGSTSVVIIDPGPDDPDHLRAIVDAVADRTVTHIFVTHSHLDHSPAAAPLSQRLGAPVCAFGPSDAGRSAVMRALEAQGYTGGGEGVDHAFSPDILLMDGMTISTGAGPFVCLHTPGHMGNHICLEWREVCFVGDLVMGWSTSLVSPPDGDMTDFLASCQRMQTRGVPLLYPAHGAPITEPTARLQEVIAHRLARKAEILAGLKVGDRTIEGLVTQIYAQTPPALHPAAARNVFAHLIDLVAEGQVCATPALGPDATYSLMDLE